MGGFGGGVSVEVVESDSQCLGEEAIPLIPGVPAGTTEASTFCNEQYNTFGSIPNHNSIPEHLIFYLLFC